MEQTGDSVSLSASVRFNGLAVTQSSPADRFSWGLFSTSDGAGYLAANDTSGPGGVQSLWRKPRGDASSYHSTDGAAPLASFDPTTPDFADGLYQLVIKLTRRAGAIDYSAALVRSSDGVVFSAFTGSDLSPATFSFDRVGFRAGDALDATSIEIGDCMIAAGRSTYSGRDLHVPDGGIFYQIEGPLHVANLLNEGTMEFSGGGLTATGSLQNRGMLRLKGSSSITAAGGIVNSGTFDLISATGPLPMDIVNTGNVLDIHSVQLSFCIQNSDLSLSMLGFAGHFYQLQQDAGKKLTGSWVDVGAPVPGTGSTIGFNIAGGASISPSFFRIKVDP